MSLEEKAGQVLITPFWGLSRNTVSQAIETMEKFHLGGHFQLGNKPETLAYCNERLQKAAKIPLLVGSDLERGPGQGIRGAQRFPSQMCRAAGGDEKTEYEIGKITALQGRAVGINFTAGPVVDVNTNRHCPDINTRSYGTNARKVSNLAVACIRGLQENGMLAQAKHFPGNGASEIDQHVVPALVPVSKKQMYDIYLRPFRDAIKKADLGSVMVGHLEVPCLTREKNPKSGRTVVASVSGEIMTGVLKKELGFGGFAMTDALNMGGINNDYTPEERAVASIAAGMDMLLIFTSQELERAHSAIVRAAENGVIPMGRLNDAVRRILRAKARLGLPKTRGLPVKPASRKLIINSRRHDPLFRKICRNAVTVLDNRGNILPLKRVHGKRVLLLNTFVPDEYIQKMRHQEMPKVALAARLRKAGARVSSFNAHAFLSGAECGRMHWEIGRADIIFMNLFVRPMYAVNTLMPNCHIMGLLFNGIFGGKTPVVVTSFGDPFQRAYFPMAPVYVCVYNDSVIAQEAVADVWLGKAHAFGKTPVTLEYMFEEGDGIRL